MAKGITGKLTLCDGKTGIPRTIVDIEKAAKLTVRENGKQFCNSMPNGSPASPDTDYPEAGTAA
jgi:hypothetical protein